MQVKKYPAMVLLCLLSVISPLLAQDKLPIKFGKVTSADFNIQSSLLDSNTNAIVVADVGFSEFMANTTDLNFSLIFKHKKRTKIITKNGFDAATVVIPLYVGGTGNPEKLEELKAYTYNIENGKVEETKVDKESVFTENHNKNWLYKKFTFPKVKEGSIIEYSYQVKSDYLFNLQPWEFQEGNPVLWSQYEARIPEFFKYVILSQGYQPFFINKVDKSLVSFTFTQHVAGEFLRTGATGSGSETFKEEGTMDNHLWVMKNVPGLKEEAFTTTLRNSIAKIEFQLKQIAYSNSFPKDYMNNWEKACADLLENERFGLQINRANNWLDDEVEAIVKGTGTAEAQAKKIYEYVRDNFTSNGNAVTVTTSLKDVLKNKGGTVADINMLLIAMLRSRKITAEPVILSTRNHGFTNEFYPLMDRFNYTIVQVMLNDHPVYLDASVPRLSYGKLPSQVYNGHARLVTKKATPIFFVADSIKEASVTSVFVSNMEKGGVEGSFNNKLGFYESLQLRNKLAKSSFADFKKTVQENYPEDISISNIEVDSLKILDEPVGISYEMKLKSFGEADIVYFSPMMDEAIRKNPFTAAERYYPVEMPYTTENIYTLSMDVPNGYKVDELPKSVRFNLNEDEGMFEYLISNDGQAIQMRCRLLLRKAKYLNEDYQSLREFYSFVVKKEAEQIVFKKIK